MERVHVVVYIAFGQTHKWKGIVQLGSQSSCKEKENPDQTL